MTSKTITMELIDKIIKANRIIIYGAKMIAAEIIPVCEAFAGREKINIVTTYGGGVLEGYDVLPISDIDVDKKDIILVAMREAYFDEIRQMAEIENAGCVVWLNQSIIREAKLHALRDTIKRLGIDLRLFNHVDKYEILGQVHAEKVNDIDAKAWELATEETARYVVKHMRSVNVFQSRGEYHSWLKEVIRENQTEKGINFEFGVASGGSLRTFATDGINKFFGFDSFEGLPENWIPGVEKGTFNMEEIPWMPKNVELVKGWFDKTLPVFVDRHDIVGKKADFIHIDCDLYNSTKSVFDYMAKFIKKGTIIAFDEYFNYPGWQMDEFKAFHEFVEANNIKYEYMAYVNKDLQVCVRVL